MSFLPEDSRVYSAKSFHSIAFATRIMTIVLVPACMLWLSIRTYSAGSNSTLEPAIDNLGHGVELALSDGAAAGQVSTSLGGVKINIEAYNKKREKDIADASRKLLSLAISLKSDLDHNSSSEPSPNTVSKARQIQKLAHDVKEMMKINMVRPY
jgi:hypothetical protein